MIVWTEQATQQLDQVREYIVLSKTPEVAFKVVLQILASIEQLARFPMLGRSGRVPGTRELVVVGTPFIAAYILQRDRIVVLAIYHGSQQWPEAL